MVMAVFAYIYHQSFVVPQSFSVEMILEQVSLLFSFQLRMDVTFHFHIACLKDCYPTVDTDEPYIRGDTRPLPKAWSISTGEAG